MSEYRNAQVGFEKGQKAVDRPELVTDEYLGFLDGLRESGVTNMFGARPYLKEEFPELTGEEAAQILSYWMKTFGGPR